MATNQGDSRAVVQPVANPAWNSPNAFPPVAVVDVVASLAADASASATLAVAAAADEAASALPRTCESAPCASPNPKFLPVRPVLVSPRSLPVARRCSRKTVVAVGSTAAVTRASAAVAADSVVADCYPAADIDAGDIHRVNSSDSLSRVQPTDSRFRTLHRTCRTVRADSSDWSNSLNSYDPVRSVVDTDGNASNFHRRCLLAAVNSDGASCRPDRSACSNLLR